MKQVNLKRLHTVWFQIQDILEKAKLWSKYKDQWLSGMGRGRRDEWSEHRKLLGQWKYSVWYYNKVYVITHLPKPTECTTARVNPSKLNYVLQVIMSCLYRFTPSKKKVTFWWVILVIEETIHVWGPGVYDISLYLHLNYVVNLKVLYKRVFKRLLDLTTKCGN